MAKATLSRTTIRTTPLERAHIDFVRTLSALPPPRVIGAADAADIESTADYVRLVYLAAVRYLEGVVDNAIDHISSDVDVDWIRVNIAVWDTVNVADADVSAAAGATLR